MLETRLRKLAFAVTVASLICLFVLEAFLSGEQGFLKGFFERLFEALLIAGLLSLVLDGVAKAEIADAAATRVDREWKRLSNESLWVLLNENAWPEHKEWVIAMAKKRTFLRQGVWRVTVTEDPNTELLHLAVAFEGRGQTFDPRGAFPYGDAPLLASSDGRESQHVKYCLSHEDVAKGRHTTVIEADRALINAAENDLTEVRSDGATMLHVDKLKTDFSNDAISFQPGDRFTLTHDAEVYRHRRGFFPMYTSWTSCETSVKVTNNSVVDLEFTLARLDELQVHTLVDGDEKSIGLLPPGCAFILSWGERAAGETQDFT